MLRALPDREAVPEDPAGGRGLSAAGRQAEEEAGTLRLRRGAVLQRRQPDGVGREKQGPGRVSASRDNKEFWEEEKDGRDKLLTDSR